MDLKQLLDAKPVFDEENLSREVLAAKLISWLSHSMIFGDELPKLRAMVREISGLPAEQELQDIPKTLAKSLHVYWSALTPVNRRALVDVSMAYMDIGEKNCADLFGAKRWKDITYAIDVLCMTRLQKSSMQQTAPTGAKPGSLGDDARYGSTQWSKNMATDMLLHMLRERHFTFSALQEVGQAIQALLAAQKIAPLMVQEDIEASCDFNVLKTLTWTAYEDISGRCTAGLPDVFLMCCGVNEAIAKEVLGDENWTMVDEVFTKMRNQEHPPVIEGAKAIGFFERLKNLASQIVYPVKKPQNGSKR